MQKHHKYIIDRIQDIESEYITALDAVESAALDLHDAKSVLRAEETKIVVEGIPEPHNKNKDTRDAYMREQLENAFTEVEQCERVMISAKSELAMVKGKMATCDILSRF